MRGRLGMILAATMMMGGLGTTMSMPAPRSYRKPQEPPKMEGSLEDRTQMALDLIIKENVERQNNFPKWKRHYVNGVSVVASNPKNAQRHYDRAMRQYGLN
jgi:hypothetical protein